MPSNQEDYKSKYEAKCIEFDQLSQQFNELQQQSTLFMNDLQDQNKQLKRKNDMLEKEIKDLKEKKKYMTSTIERELDQAQKEKNEFKTKFKDFQKKVISLEIINQDLQNELRATKSTLEEYQASTEKTMQELAILRVELQQSTNANQQQIARLRQQLKQTEQEISIMHKKIKKTDSETLSQKNNNKQQQKSQRQLSIIDEKNKTPISVKRSQSGLNQNITGQNQANYKNTAFKDTLREIRDYLQTIDGRKDELRKNLLVNRQYLTATTY